MRLQQIAADQLLSFTGTRALAGAILGRRREVRRMMRRRRRRLMVAGALLPLTLFSGESQTTEIIYRATEIGAGMLIVLALVKLLITSLCLATGYKGGYIFPTMFAGAALGMAMHLIFPAIPEAVAVAATLGGAMVATLKAPIFSALFVMVLVQHETSPLIAIAVIVGALATARISMTSAEAPQAAPTPEARLEQNPA